MEPEAGAWHQPYPAGAERLLVGHWQVAGTCHESVTKGARIVGESYAEKKKRAAERKQQKKS
jgi:hypothetical protein